MPAAPVTLIHHERVTSVAGDARGDDLWLAAPDLARAAGWELKPAGLCRGSTCVPLPAGREGELVDADGRVNLADLARHLAEPVVHDETGAVWVVGRSAAARASSLRSLVAPNFTLPDLDGQPHSLAQERGKKVLLVSWASW